METTVTCSDIVSIFYAVTPSARACGPRLVRNGGKCRQYGCSVCGAVGPTFAGQWPETRASIEWRRSHECPAFLMARYARLAATPAGQLVEAIDRLAAHRGTYRAAFARTAYECGDYATYRTLGGYVSPSALLTVEERAAKKAAGAWLLGAWNRSVAARKAAKARKQAVTA